jgi:hypothetical protein
VALFNGLDSISEVEMHAFGDRMLGRGFAVLALDLPAGLSSRPRAPLLAVETVAPGLADRLEAETGVPLAAFGVSFGGQLAARALAGDRRFRAAVAVSTGAWLDPRHLAVPRIRAMVRFAFALDGDAGLGPLVEASRITALPPPAGRLLVLHMGGDTLFGPEHSRAVARWGGGGSEMWRLEAEHVGTSRIHVWLPEVCDWLDQAATAAGGTRCEAG